jgi:antigen flippase
MWPQFLAYASTIGVPVASVYYLKRRPDLAGTLSGTAIAISVVMGFVASLVGYFIIPHSLHTYPPAVIHFAQHAVFVAPLALLGVTLFNQAQSAGSFKHYNIFRFAPPLSILLVLWLEKLSGVLNSSHAALAYLLAGTPIMIYNLAWISKRFAPTLKGSLVSARLLLGYGVRAWGADLLGMVANQVDRLLVVGMLGPESMGLYVVAQSAAGVINAIPGAVVSVTLPKAAGKSADDIVALTGRSARLTLLIMLLVSLPLLTVGGFLLKLVYGGKFLMASVVLRFLVVETILDGLTAVLSQAFLAAGYPGTVTILQGLGVLSAVPLLYWLIPLWGLKGAGCALMLATGVRFTFILLNFPLRLKVPPPHLVIGKEEIMALIRSRQLAPPIDT